jgi:hypothetical protein
MVQAKKHTDVEEADILLNATSSNEMKELKRIM